MKAADFLDITKRRMLCIEFADFTLYDSYTGLLDVQLSEVMSDSPDVVIGDIVVPELTVELRALDLSGHLDETISCTAGLEQSREDVSEELRLIQEAIGGTQMCFARMYTGGWVAAEGNQVYSQVFTASGYNPRVVFTTAQDITGLRLDETHVNYNQYGQVATCWGTAYFLHDTAPYLTKADYTGAKSPNGNWSLTFAGSTEEEEVTVSDPLWADIIGDGSGSGISTSRIALWHYVDLHHVPYAELIQVLDVRFARYYDGGTLRRRAVSAEVTQYAPASFGEFVLTETAAQDEETVEVLCYGILGQLVKINAAEFLHSGYGYVHAGDSFAQLFQNFLTWLGTKGIPLTAAEQTYLNLDDLTVIAPDWTQLDVSGLTAADVLRCFALLEGGNARMNHDNKLELGWGGTEPVMTVSADRMASLRIGAERLAPATGMTYYQPNTRNVIESSVPEDKLVLMQLTSASALESAYAAIVRSFENGAHLPVTAELLCGGSPLLRAGDCIKAVTRAGAAVNVQLFQQELDRFPLMRSRVSTPEGTGWATEPIDFYALEVIGITVTGWPAFLVSGFPPDTSGMTVTAVQRWGNSFPVDETLYTVTVGAVSNGRAPMTVSFCGFSVTNRLLPVGYALYNSHGQPLTTADGSLMIVWRSN